MISKVKSTIKNNRFILISGASSLFIILIVYFCHELIPFGNGIIYRMDLYHQYGPLFSELYDRLVSGESLLYSWNSGLGTSFLGNFFNYLSSPVTFIILLFGHNNTFEAVAAMIAIKCVLSSMSLSYYLKKSQKADNLFISAFGILYSFCGYFIAYYWNVMWIDAMYILPFVVLGIEKIIDKGNAKTYFLALILAIFTNYYIGYMICIFSCIYFIYYYLCSVDRIKAKKALLTDNKGFFKKISNSFFLTSGFKFAFASLGAAIVLAAMLLPLASVLQASSATKGTLPTEFKFYFNIFDFLANHLASLEPTIRSSGNDVLPNIYCGILTLMLIPAYIFSKRISAREKIASSVLLAFLYLSFNVNYLNFAWHGFHFPNDLPYRQSFMYSFILVVLAFKALQNIDEYSHKQIIGFGIGVIVFIVLAQKLTSKNVTETTVYISAAFVFAYTVILGIISSRKSQMFALSVMLVCTVAAESITANTDHYVANQSKESYVNDFDKFKEIQSVISDSDDSMFYREELSNLRARMDPCWYDYNGVSVFSSMAYEKVANLQKYIGLYGNKINSYTYNPQTPIYNAMFSVKYIYDKSSYISECEYYTCKTANEIFTAYENNYMLNIAYPVSDNVLGWDASSLSDPVTVQEEYFKAATGVEGVFNRIYDYEILYGNILSIDRNDVENGSFVMNKISNEYPGSITVDITAQSSDNIYIYVYSRNLDTVSAYSTDFSNTMNVSDGYILDLGSHKPGETVSVAMPLKDSVNSANVDFIAFTVNNDKFVEGYNKLKDGQIEYTRFDETVIKGKFKAESDEILYTSIPYEKNWKVYIDGKAVSDDDIVKLSDALLGVKVSEGEHTVSFVYSTNGIKGSLLISLVFIILLLIFSFMKKKRILLYKNRKQNLWEKSEIISNKICEDTQNNNEEIIIDFDEKQGEE